MEGHFNFNPDVFCEEDKLGFNQYIRTLSGMIKNPNFKTPFCIGVYGKWGSGKTSFMRLLSREIIKNAKKPYIIPVWFNPWRYEKEEHLIIPFLKTLEVELEKFADKNKSQLKDAFESVKGISVRAGQTAAAIASALSIECKLMGLGVSLEASKAVEREEDLVKEYKERKKSLAARLSSLYFDINETLKMSANEKKFRIVIFIDDLDRCLPEKAVNLLESVKLFIDIPGYLFVIGVDRDVVEKGIAYHYRHLDHSTGKKEDSATVKSKDYLDKMIQFPLDLPPVESTYKSGYIKSLLAGNRSYEDLAGLIEKGVGDNPRELKRFVNLLAFISWHADTIKKDILNGKETDENKRRIEANFIPVIYVKWSLIVFKFPDEYNDIKANRHLLIEMQDIAVGKAKEEDRKATKSVPPKLKEILKEGKEFSDNDFFLKNLIHLVQAARVEAAAEKTEIRHPKEAEYKLGDMVRIYKGSFLYGEDKREINIDYDYEMDVFPVTNKQYQEFINDDKENKVPYLDEEWAKPYNWDLNKRTFPPDKDNRPVVLVSYEDAEKFCEWRTKKNNSSEEEKYRLPTEEEWEKAARGNDGWEYPWGNEFDKEKCNSKESGNKCTIEVTRYPTGASPYGCQDMAGNVWEWTDSWYDENKSSKVVRGGSGFHEAYFCRCASRTWFHLDKRSQDVGFRCARTLKH